MWKFCGRWLRRVIGTLVKAHQLFKIDLLEKEEEIHEKDAEVHEKEAEIHEKEAEILELKCDAEDRLRIIDQLTQSYYYRLGYVLLEPALSLKRLIRSWGK